MQVSQHWSEDTAWLQEPCCMGIDEAGRGPVLGPMVYGACVCPMSRHTFLKSCGVADSKVLSAEKRDEVFARLKRCDSIGWLLASIPAEELSAKMLQISKESLNVISHDTAIHLVKLAQVKGVNITHLYVDTVGTPSFYQSRLQRLFPDLTISVEKKADATYPVVSAASICAKVLRDKTMHDWQFKEKNYEGSRAMGSGYPADPDTQKWLKSNIDPVFGYPSVMRFSWKTCQSILNNEAAPVKWPGDLFLEDEDPTQTTLFATAKKSVPRYKFFGECAMEQITPDDTLL
eukprot:TRINITY_DN17170_c0_g1_i1.p1 TRINITY_DN17170_c0_g1~~TRINITY_DN17170_c0_g1_i1.p1  ORF type:complete len:289 (-),score=58.17 TRINITY_DN17170_c0_g1_i1:95-961(-)